MSKQNFCAYCGHLLNRKVNNIEAKLETGTGMLHGKQIFNAILRGKFRSIDLCNFDYTLLRIYRQRREDANFNA